MTPTLESTLEIPSIQSLILSLQAQSPTSEPLKCEVSTRIPTSSTSFRLLLYTSPSTPIPHLALIFTPSIQSKSLNAIQLGDTTDLRRRRGASEFIAGHVEHSDVRVRLHSSCFTGECLGSTRCDCQEQLHTSIEHLSVHGGVLVYLQQEGRDIGLLEKMKAYNLIDMGFDTYSANIELGHKADARSYTPAIEILRDLSISSVILFTNNPLKIEACEDAGIRVRREEMVPKNWKDGKRGEADGYLMTKVLRMGHFLNLPDFLKSDGDHGRETGPVTLVKAKTVGEKHVGTIFGHFVEAFSVVNI